MRKILFVLMAVAAILTAGFISCDPLNVPEPPDNKEQIRTQQEEDGDSVPPGHHPENDDDDPYGGKYDPIWLH